MKNFKLKLKFPTYSLIITAFTSGILMGLTVAPFGAWFLAWFALAPLWVLVVTGKRENLLLPFAWGVGYHGIALFWITGIHPLTWLGVPWLASLAIALFCWTFITFWGVALVVVWAACLSWILRRSQINTSLTSVVIGTALWCGLESLWGTGPLYWSSLSYTQSPHNLLILHLGQLSGNSAITAAIVAVNGLIAQGWINRKGFLGETSMRVYLGMAIVLLITLHLIGLFLYTRPLLQPAETALKVGIVQGNIPNQIKLYPEGFRRAIQGYTTGYLNLVNQGVDVVLTPEGALPFSQDAILDSSLVAAVREKKVPAWVGGFDKQKDHYTNSLFTITGKGEIFSHYGKVKMVPIGEYIPFEGILGGIVKRLSPLDEHQVPGKTNQIFTTPFGRAIVSICYESAFEEIFRYQAAAGGGLILSVSNDAHFSAVMPRQHHAQDIMRAIATDRWAARATNTGYSAFVNPHGKTKWISQLNTYQINAGTIYRRQTQTFYVRWGNWLTPLLLGLAPLNWFVFYRENRK